MNNTNLPKIGGNKEFDYEDRDDHPEESKDHSLPKFPELEGGKEELNEDERAKKMQHEKIEEELNELSKDMWFTKLLVKKTWLIILISVVLALILSIISFVLGGFDMSEDHQRNFLLWNSKQVKEWDMLELANEKVQTNYANGLQPLRTTTKFDWYTSVTFECSNCETILTVDLIKQMYYAEQEIVNHPDYVNFCKATSSSDDSCSSGAYTSFAKNFESTITTFTQTDVDNYLATIAGSDSIYKDNYLFLEKSFTRTNLISKKARATFLFASPIEYGGKRYNTYTDEEFDQKDDFVEFSLDVEEKVTGFSSSLDIGFYNSAWYNEKMNELVMEDFNLAILSFVFVMVYVAFHLKSAFLSATAMMAIALSFPVTILITRFIFQIDYFSSLNLIAIFVILGISADNVFVFMDSWNQSMQFELLNTDTENKYNNFQKRMNYTWRRATKAIFTTSLTTALAFLATGFSKIMPIAAFGYFACFLVLVNFTFAVVVFPALVILFERHLVHRCKYRKFIGTSCSKLFRKW